MNNDVENVVIATVVVKEDERIKNAVIRIRIEIIAIVIEKLIIMMEMMYQMRIILLKKKRRRRRRW